MAAVLVDSRETFQALLAKARALTAELAENTDYREALEEAARQLELMAERTAGGASPDRDEQLRTSLGPLGLRCFGESHPDYAKLLKELDYAFRRHGALP
jgi:hypothetical protein